MLCDCEFKMFPVTVSATWNRSCVTHISPQQRVVDAATLLRNTRVKYVTHYRHDVSTDWVPLINVIFWGVWRKCPSPPDPKLWLFVLIWNSFHCSTACISQNRHGCKTATWLLTGCWPEPAWGRNMFKDDRQYYRYCLFHIWLCVWRQIYWLTAVSICVASSQDCVLYKLALIEIFFNSF